MPREARRSFSLGQTPWPPDTSHSRQRPRGSPRNAVSEENASNAIWKEPSGSEEPTEGPFSVCWSRLAGQVTVSAYCGMLHCPRVPRVGPASAFQIKHYFSLCTDQHTNILNLVNR